MKSVYSLQRRTGIALAGMLLATAGMLTAQSQQEPAVSVVRNLSFAHQGSPSTTPPAAQTIRVVSNPQNIPFTATATTVSGGSWLLVNNGLQMTGNTGTTGQDIAVSVSPNLPAGVYTGDVVIRANSTTVNVSVMLVVTAAAVPRINPASVSVTVETGRTVTLPVTITSTGTASAWVAEITGNTPATNWLQVGPNFGDAGTPTSLFINTNFMPAGTTVALGNVRFRSAGSDVTMPVTVVVTPAAQLVATPTTVTFPYQIGATLPTTRSVQVTSSTQTQLGYTATITSSSPWLSLATAPAGASSATVTGTTPGTLFLVPNLSSVPSTPGTLQATVRLTTPNGSSTQDITANLVISTQPQFVLGQSAVNFSYSLGGTTPAAQQFQLSSTSGNQAFTAIADYSTGGQFFTVSPQQGITPATMTVGVNQSILSGLSAGTYAGTIRISATGGATESVPVTLTVSGSALLTVTPALPPAFEGLVGQPQGERSLTVTSTDGTAQPFSVSTEYLGSTSGWLNVSPLSGVTGTSGVLRYNVSPSAIATAGTYEANIVVTPTGVAGAPPVRVPIRYIVTSLAQVKANPERLDLIQTGTTPPEPQSIALTGPNVTYFVRSSVAWIKLVYVDTTIPGVFRASFDTASMTPGEYTGEILVTPSGLADVKIPVTLRVQSTAQLQVNPSTLTFRHSQGATNPAAQTLNLASSGTALSFTASATTTTGGTWLTVSPASGTTGASGAAATPLQVSVNPTGLGLGTYQGTVRIASTTAANSPVNVNVTLTVAAPSAPSGIVISNSATNAPRALAPGEIIMIKGQNMAPANGLTAVITNGRVQTELGEVTVEFDGIRAPLLYVGPAGDKTGDQINAIVPYEVAGRPTTRVIVTYRGVRSEAIEVRMQEADPGIFTASQTGSGQGSILNQNSSVNSSTNPAAAGSVIQIFATGEGQVVPAGITGQVIQTANDLRKPLGVVTATVNGVPATVEYAGSAPTLVSGVLQVNVRLPQNLNITGATSVPVEIRVGNLPSQSNVTVAVRP